ncbi:MAG: hypothetical protein U0892_07360 [Pirellulales bacterium]
MQELNPAENPYAVVALPEFATPVRRIRLRPMVCPPEVSNCPYFSAEDFGQQFMQQMMASFPKFGIEVVTDTVQSDPIDAEVACRVVSINPMTMTAWQRFLKYFPLSFGYRYMPASFCVECAILAGGGVLKLIVLPRQIRHRPFTERSDMEIALRGEAMHAVGQTAVALGLTKPKEGGKSFWFTALWIPLGCGLVSGLATRGGFEIMRRIQPFMKNAEVEFQILAAVISLLTAIGFWFTVTAFLPARIYSHPSALFVYRFAATNKAWHIRAMFAIVGFLSMLPILASCFNALFGSRP